MSSAQRKSRLHRAGGVLQPWYESTSANFFCAHHGFASQTRLFICMSYSPLRSSSSDGDSPVRAIYARNGARSVTQMMNGFDEPVGATDREELPLLAPQQQAFLEAVQHELAVQRHALHKMSQQLDAMHATQARRTATPPPTQPVPLPPSTDADSAGIRQTLALLHEQLREQRLVMQQTRAQLDALQRDMQVHSVAAAANVAGSTLSPAYYASAPGTIRTDTLILGSLAVVLLLLIVCTVLLAIVVSRPRSATTAHAATVKPTAPAPTLISS